MTPKSIAQIRGELTQCDPEDLPAFIKYYQDDTRSGVQALLEKASRQIAKYEAELKRLETMREYERHYGTQVDLICGVDEAGRGPLAGPVAAGAVILPRDCEILYLNDSKKLSEKRREELFYEIREKAIAWGVGLADEKRIDEINILQAEYPDSYTGLYGIEAGEDPAGILLSIAEARHCLKKGGEPDVSKAASLLLDDFRAGRLGRITLEVPGDSPDGKA